jgi:hypothetical protein
MILLCVMTPYNLVGSYHHFQEHTTFIQRTSLLSHFYPEDERSRFLRNGDNHLPYNTLSGDRTLNQHLHERATYLSRRHLLHVTSNEPEIQLAGEAVMTDLDLSSSNVLITHLLSASSSSKLLLSAPNIPCKYNEAVSSFVAVFGLSSQM